MRAAAAVAPKPETGEVLLGAKEVEAVALAEGGRLWEFFFF